MIGTIKSKMFSILISAVLVSIAASAMALPSFEDTPPEKRKEGQIYVDKGGQEIYWPKGLVSSEDVFGGELHKVDMPTRGYTDADLVTAGFKLDKLGKVPANGGHPRLFIVPEDIERIRENLAKGDDAPDIFRAQWKLLLQQGKISPDGKVEKVAKHAESSIWGSTSNLGRQLLYAHVVNDDDLGRRCAVEVFEEAKRAHKYVDVFQDRPEWDNNWVVTDTRYLPDGHFAKHAHQWYWPCFSEEYDLAWRWLTDDERDAVRELFVRMTADRYTHFMELPSNKHLINHASMATEWMLMLLVIKGEEGFDQKVYDLARTKMGEFLDWYISPDGEMYENVKGFLPWQMLLAIGRHEDGKILMHPHLQAMHRRVFLGARNVMNRYVSWSRPPVRGKKEAEFMDVRNPESRTWQTRTPGHYQPMSTMMKWLYPERADYDFVYKAVNRQLNQLFVLDEDATTWVRPVEYPAIELAYATDGLTDDAGKSIDWNKTDVDFEKQLSLADPERGMSEIRSSWDKDALQLRYECRSDFYTGGHETPEYGSFWFASHGVYWTPYQGPYQPVVHRNMVTVDGKAGAYPPVPGRFVKLEDSGQMVSAVCEYSQAIQYKMHFAKDLIQHPKLEIPFHHWMRASYCWDFSRDYQAGFLPHHRWFNEYLSSTDFSQWDGQATMNSWYERILPEVKKAWRTLQFSRGDKPYLLVIDDIEMDGEIHDYRWNLNLSKDITLYKQSGANDLHLTWNDTDWQRNAFGQHTLNTGYKPKKGQPMLLVRVLHRNAEHEQPHPRFEISDGWPMVVVPARTVAPDYRVLVYPYRFGDPLPITIWSEDKTQLSVLIGEQEDIYDFDMGPDGRTICNVQRDGQAIQALAEKPAKPVFINMHPVHRSSRYELKGPDLGPSPQVPDHETTPTKHFLRSTMCEMESPGPGRHIRYTTNGKDPNESSKLYVKPFKVNKAMTVKARTYHRRWEFGDVSASDVSVAEYRSNTIVSHTGRLGWLEDGLICRVYEIFKPNWDTTGHFNPDLNLMPDLDKYEPILTTVLDEFELPDVTPQNPIEQQYKGFYRYSGVLNLPTSAMFSFKIHSCGPVVFKIRGVDLINETGQYHQNLTDRYGAIRLGSGPAIFDLIVCDPVFHKMAREGKMPFSFEVSINGRNTEGLNFAPVPGDWCKGDGKLIMKYKKDKPKEAKPEEGRIFMGTTDVDVDYGLMKKIYNRTKMTPAGDGWLHSSKAGPAGLLDVDKLEPVEVSVIDGTITGSDYDGQVVVYDGYYKAPYEGVYEFFLDEKGNNQMYVKEVVVTQNNVPGDKPYGKVLLDDGLIPISIRMGRSGGIVKVKTPADSEPVALSFADLYRPVDAEQELDVDNWLVWDFPMDKLGKEKFKASGALGKFDVEVRGAKVAADDRFGKVLELSGVKSGIVLRDWPCVANEATFCFWVNRADDKQHSLFNLSGEGAEAYVNGNYMTMKYSRFAGAGVRDNAVLKDKWFHCTLVFGDYVKMYINGKLAAKYFAKGHPTMASRPNNKNIRTDQLSLFGGRGAGGPYLKGSVADMKLYNKILTDEQIMEVYNSTK